MASDTHTRFGGLPFSEVLQRLDKMHDERARRAISEQDVEAAEQYMVLPKSCQLVMALTHQVQRFNQAVEMAVTTHDASPLAAIAAIKSMKNDIWSFDALMKETIAAITEDARNKVFDMAQVLTDVQSALTEQQEKNASQY